MEEPPLIFPRGVTLIGGGAVDRAGFEAARARAPHVVAADGGANVLREWGETPEAVIGDMDSIRDLDFWRGRTRLLPLAEQETTDLEKCLHATAAPVHVGVGFLGRRFDHTLAAAHVLLRRAEKRVVLIGEDDLAFLAPTRWRARLAPGARVSVYPLRPVTGLASEGLVWPLDGLALAAGERIGTSNRAAAETVAVAFDRPGALVMLERRFLDAAIESLGEA